jgi:GTPase
LEIERLLEGLRRAEPRALARALTLVESGAPEAKALLEGIPRRPRHAVVVGITGPAGVGKSTLVDALTRKGRAGGREVAVLAIDPTSPVTGGALLGDRARMDSGAKDPSIFIRSMATRGHVGGLAAAAFEALVLLEAAGKDFILVETVGAGQDEVEVASAVDVTVLVLAPGLGDDVQAAKAGIMELANVLVVNKADRDGAELLFDQLNAVSDSRPVRKTVALEGVGVDELFADVLRLGATPSSTSSDRHRVRLEAWLEGVLATAVRERISEEAWSVSIRDLEERKLTPREAADRLLLGLERREGNATTGVGMRIHHVGIAVRSVDEAAARFGDLLGLETGARYELPEFGVTALFLPVGDGEGSLELLEPVGAGSTVESFLEKRGEGIHHVCIEVEDIGKALSELAARGARLIDKEPRPGAGGHLVAFIHPKSTHGVLVELKQAEVASSGSRI